MEAALLSSGTVLMFVCFFVTENILASIYDTMTQSFQTTIIDSKNV